MYPEIGEQFYLILARPEDLDALWKEGWRHFGSGFLDTQFTEKMTIFSELYH